MFPGGSFFLFFFLGGGVYRFGSDIALLLHTFAVRPWSTATSSKWKSTASISEGPAGAVTRWAMSKMMLMSLPSVIET